MSYRQYLGAMQKTTAILILSSFVFTLNAQNKANNKEFISFVKNDSIGKEQITGNEKHIQFFTKYLGKLELPNKNNYYVITQFYTVQAALVKHGHSRIIFLDNDKKTIKIYVLDMRNQLPLSIVRNALIFKFDNKKYKLRIKAELPSMLCLPNNIGCY